MSGPRGTPYRVYGLLLLLILHHDLDLDLIDLVYRYRPHPVGEHEA